VVRRGQVVWAPKFQSTITVCRVARDGAWADIEVQSINPLAVAWRKRQPLRDGEFPFRVEEVEARQAGYGRSG